MLIKLLRGDLNRIESFIVALEAYRRKAVNAWRHDFNRFLAKLLYEKDLWRSLGYVRERYYRYLLTKPRA